MSKSYKCCYCGKLCHDYGNNPDCWNDTVWKAEDRCCNDCNTSIVIPSRIKIMYKMREED